MPMAKGPFENRLPTPASADDRPVAGLVPCRAPGLKPATLVFSMF